MSGYTDGAIAAHGFLESGISILRKPFTRRQLTQSIADVLARKECQGALSNGITYAQCPEEPTESESGGPHVADFDRGR
jgi:hypothetical protein